MHCDSFEELPVGLDIELVILLLFFFLAAILISIDVILLLVKLEPLLLCIFLVRCPDLHVPAMLFPVHLAYVLEWLTHSRRARNQLFLRSSGVHLGFLPYRSRRHLDQWPLGGGHIHLRANESAATTLVISLRAVFAELQHVLVRRT